MSQQSDRHEKKRIVLIVILVCFMVFLWLTFSPNGFLNYYELKKNVEKLQIENQDVAQKNEELQREISGLENDPAYIEELARTRYNMVKKNEFVIDFNKKKKHH